MILRLMGALFAPKYPRNYTGRHRERAVRAVRAEREQATGRLAINEAAVS